MSKAGQYREQVTFYFHPTTTSDGAGGQVIDGDYSTIELPAKIQALRAVEELSNGVVKYTQAFKITVRYNEQLRHSMQVRWLQRVMNVTSIQHEERMSETVLYTIAVH